MKPEQVALWIGIASSIGGAAVGYGTLTEKVAALESGTDATHLESRLTKLEVRIEDNDIGTIGKEIQQLRGEHEKLSDKVSSIRVPSTGAIKSDIRVLENKVVDIQDRLKDLDSALKEVGKPSNPLQR